jgi:hypothetical protein
MSGLPNLFRMRVWSNTSCLYNEINEEKHGSTPGLNLYLLCEFVVLFQLDLRWHGSPGISRRVLRGTTYDPRHWTFYFVEGDLVEWLASLSLNAGGVAIASQSVHRGKTETHGPKFRFLATIYRFVCEHILCIGHKWNISAWSYKMSGETFWSGVWFSYKKDLEMGCKNQNWKHRPVINVTCQGNLSFLCFIYMF